MACDLDNLSSRLTDALEKFDWRGAETVCGELVACLYSGTLGVAPARSKAILGALRRKRQFEQIGRVAEALIRTRQGTALVRRQYAQALIDRKLFLPAERILEGILSEEKSGPEELEAIGLTGRIYKQLYVDANDPKSPVMQGFLARALAEYMKGYWKNTDENLWHGINAVAVAARAERDGVTLPNAPNRRELAAAIRARVEQKEQNAVDELPPWDIAVALEAEIALVNEEGARCRAMQYHSMLGADAFEIGSTLRQLQEVWQLDADRAPAVISLLKAALLKREGGQITLAPSDIHAEISHVNEANARLERVFGVDRTRTLIWYQKGLERARSVCRIERRDGKGFGTGWLVSSQDFFPDRPADEQMVLTNYHVVSKAGDGGSLEPNEAQANFEVDKEIRLVTSVFWESSELDAAFLTLEGGPVKSSPVPLSLVQVTMPDPPAKPRLFIIGHPGGRGLEFSLEDNVMLGVTPRLVHYRTPTEKGSSGSPVFEALAWEAVALHHAGGSDVLRLDRQGTYDANEGIAILAILGATKAR